jgi:hypothetical protein
VLDKLPKIRTHQHDPIEAAERIIAQMPNPPRIEYLRIDGILQCQYGLHLSAPRELFTSPARTSAGGGIISPLKMIGCLAIWTPPSTASIIRHKGGYAV